VSTGRPDTDRLADLQKSLLAAEGETRKKRDELKEQEEEILILEGQRAEVVTEQTLKKENLAKYEKSILILTTGELATGTKFANDPTFTTTTTRAANDADIATALSYLDSPSTTPPSKNGSLVKLSEYYYNKNRAYAPHEIVYGTAGRKFMSKGGFEAIMKQLRYFFFKSLDKDALFASIENTASGLGSVVGSEQQINSGSQQRAKYLFNKIINYDF
jgi:hypothetical protein